MTNIKAVNLFSCAGVCEWYLKDLGIEVVVANELDRNRARLHHGIYPQCKMVVGSIENPKVQDTLADLSNAAGCELLIASPPCQSWSCSNTNKDPDDSRSLLFMPLLDHIRRCNYKWILIENAKEYIKGKLDDKSIIGDKKVCDYIREQLYLMGYHVEIKVQNAMHFGVAQSRERTIILASKCGVWKHPEATTPTPLTLKNVIGDLESLEPNQHGTHPLHYAPHLPKCQSDCLRRTPTGKRPINPVKVNGKPSRAQFDSSYQRMSWDNPAPAILTGSASISGYTTVHPGRLLPDGTYSDPRPLSILELLRVFGLPDDWPIPHWARVKDNLLRDCLGEAFAPSHVKEICKMIPKYP
jgi:DNA (cytosine-5)-methyltransferase 1